MSLSQLETDIANMSLGRIGAKQFTLADQTPVQGVQANLHFVHTRDSLLRSFQWNFAKKRFLLVSTWLTATDYVVGQYVWTNSLLYKCLVAHTSDVFATDLSSADWILVDEESKASTLGERIKEIREQQKLTIEGCASVSGLSVDAWVAIENDTRNPKLRLLWVISSALGVRPKKLFL
jgi:DNA-binding XRE family transcriptional regulator